MKGLLILSILIVACAAVVRLPIESPGGEVGSRLWIDGNFIGGFMVKMREHTNLKDASSIFEFVHAITCNY